MDKKNEKHMTSRMKRGLAVFCIIVLVFSFSTVAFAADDPLEVVNNLSEFIFGLIRAIGMGSQAHYRLLANRRRNS